MKTLLFIIDMQNDFCTPQGSLFIPGAEDDVKELSNFIGEEAGNIDHIILTQDNHQVLNISHPGFWTDKKGNNPHPFTNITHNDIKNEKWLPKYHPKEVEEYIVKLDVQGEYTHTVWPEHCLMGSEGASIVSPVMKRVADWARNGKYYEVVIKGTHPLTEHFGAFRANIPISDAPETQLNMKLIKKLKSFDIIIVAGEAKSHCVANTIKQLFDFPEIIRKLIILDNCMSNVPNCELLARPIYEKVFSLGAKMMNTYEYSH